MGNYSSSSRKTSSNALLFDDIDSDVQLSPRILELPLHAAELMLEFPGRAVAHAVELRRTRRACALRADEPLKAGEVYLLLPVAQVGSRLSDRQMEVAAIKTKKKRGKRSKESGKRVVPVAGGEEKKKALTGEMDFGVGGQWWGCRRTAWRPALDTISE